MDELDNALQITVTGEAAKEILNRFNSRIAKWDMAMPDVEPLVLDFGLGNFAKTGLVEYWISNEFEAGYCGKYLFVFDGQSCPVHWHKDKVETFFIVKGEVEMTFLGEKRTMKPGDALKVDVNQPHGFTGKGPALLLEISKPCRIDDNYFQNRRIPIGGNYQPED